MFHIFPSRYFGSRYLIKVNDVYDNNKNNNERRIKRLNGEIRSRVGELFVFTKLDSMMFMMIIFSLFFALRRHTETDDESTRVSGTIEPSRVPKKKILSENSLLSVQQWDS